MNYVEKLRHVRDVCFFPWKYSAEVRAAVLALPAESIGRSLALHRSEMVSRLSAHDAEEHERAHAAEPVHAADLGDEVASTEPPPPAGGEIPPPAHHGD